MNAILSTLGTVAFYVITSTIVYLLLRMLEFGTEKQMDTYRRALMRVIALEAIAEWEKNRSIENIAQTAKAIDDAVPDGPRIKPCYCLGRETIEKVADDGQMQTEKVDFVAADTLFRLNPYVALKQLRGSFKVYADHLGDCKHFKGTSECTCGFRNVMEGLHD